MSSTHWNFQSLLVSISRRVDHREASVQVHSCQHLGSRIGEQTRIEDASELTRKGKDQKCESRLKASDNVKGNSMPGNSR